MACLLLLGMCIYHASRIKLKQSSIVSHCPLKKPALHCRFFVDGNLVGEIAEGKTYKNRNGTVLPVNGGRPIVTPEAISLCSRHDNDAQRHYDGLLAYLGEF